MNVILFEDKDYQEHLKPLTLTRPIGDLRVGILTIKQKWEHYLQANVSFDTTEILQQKFQCQKEENNYYINASFLPGPHFVKIITQLKAGQMVVSGTEVLAYISADKIAQIDLSSFPEIIELPPQEVKSIKHLPDLFLMNGNEIRADYALITQGRTSQELKDPHSKVYHPENIFIEDGAKLKACIINAEDGPVYIGKNAVIQEGSVIIGPAAIGEESMVAFGARIRPNTTLGPVCRVGGEVGNSIFQGYSNKAHDGFLGNSFIGEWCNLGANTNNSNLKNDYKEVSLFDYLSDELVPTGEIFCGTFMGDYSKAGISTMFNTGTVVGVSCNVFGAGFQSKFIPSFSWGGQAEGYSEYRLEKALEVINATMARRNKALTEAEISILTDISTNRRA